VQQIEPVQKEHLFSVVIFMLLIVSAMFYINPI